MAKIEIGELAGAGFFNTDESFMDSMRDLNANELKISGGSGHKGGSKKSGSKKSGSKKSSKGGGCGCGSYC
jgi:hypothetical protein